MDGRIIFHIDANSAYLSWSAVHALQHGCPIDYREIPAIVGGNQATRHGICLAKSIPAKKFGIQTGEPLVDCRRKCPNLIIIPPDYFLYMQCSQAMNEILKDYSDRIQQFSIDESFLDFTGMERIHGNPVETAHEIKDRIHRELGFTVNIGVSSNKLLAKMAGELKKPNLVHTLWPNEIPAKMWPLPVRELFMVGGRTEEKLHGMGIYTIGDLARTDFEYLKYKFKSWAIMLKAYANGVDESPVEQGGEIENIKGMGNSCTIHFDVVTKDDAYKVLLSLIETVGMRLRQGGFSGRVISVSIRTSELYSYSHQHKLIVATDCTNAIYREAKRLFNEMWRGEPIRHLGVRVSDICTNEYVQLSYLEENWETRRILDRTVDAIRFKYGPSSVYRSTFVWSGIAPIQGGVVEDFPVMSSIL